MKKITLIRFAIFALAAIAMFLSVNHSVFGIGWILPVLTCVVASCLSFKFDKFDWLGLIDFPIFMYSGAVVGLLVGLPVYFSSVQ